MQTAFEVTESDLQNVLSSNALVDGYAGDKSLSALAEELFTDLDFGLIEEAALLGDSVDEQTDNANDEIARQLREMGVLKPLPKD